MDKFHGLLGHLAFFLLVKRFPQRRGVGLVILVGQICAAADTVELSDGFQFPQIPPHRFLAAPQHLTEGGNLQTAFFLEFFFNAGKAFNFQHRVSPLPNLMLCDYLL